MIKIQRKDYFNFMKLKCRVQEALGFLQKNFLMGKIGNPQHIKNRIKLGHIVHLILRQIAEILLQKFLKSR